MKCTRAGNWRGELVSEMYDLKAEQGRVYRVDREEGYDLQPRAERPWYYRLLCRHGHVYLHGEQLLGATTSKARVGALLRAVPGVRAHQQGDRECTVTFPPVLLGLVLEVMRPYKRRVLNPEARARLETIGRATRFNGTQEAP